MNRNTIITIVLTGALLVIYLLLVQDEESVTSGSVIPLADKNGRADNAAKETVDSKEDEKIRKLHLRAAKESLTPSNPGDESKPSGRSNDKNLTEFGGFPIIWLSDLEATRMPINDFLTKVRYRVFDSDEESSEYVMKILSRAGIDFNNSSNKNMIGSRIEATNYLFCSGSWAIPGSVPTAAFETEDYFFFSLHSDAAFSKGGSVIEKKNGKIGFWVVE